MAALCPEKQQVYRVHSEFLIPFSSFAGFKFQCRYTWRMHLQPSSRLRHQPSHFAEPDVQNVSAPKIPSILITAANISWGLFLYKQQPLLGCLTPEAETILPPYQLSSILFENVQIQSRVPFSRRHR
jgi:hypothetical protein